MRRAGSRRGDGLSALLMLSPAFVAVAITRFYPAWLSLKGSFEHSSLLLGGTARWVGFDNYRFLLTDSPTFWGSVKVTLLFVGLTVVLQTALSLALAILYTQPMPGQLLLRALVFLPISIPIAVSTVVWGIAFRPDGIVNSFLQVIGVPRQPFLTSSTQALWSIIVMVSWVGVGYWMIFLIAGLKAVPIELRQASSVDGAGPVKTFFLIVLPLLRRPLAFVVVANTITNFLVFAPTQILTGGGPDGSTRVMIYEIYQQTYQADDKGLASAEIILFLIVLLGIVALQFRLINSKDER